MRARSAYSVPLVLAASLGGACLTACSPDQPYRIAVVLDRSGRDGALLAAARINARGGINGHRLALLTIPTPVATGRLAIETAERLSADQSVLAVIGHTNSSSSLAASQVYNARHLLQLSPTTTAPLYAHAGPYSYRLVPGDEHQGAYIAGQALRRGGKVQPRIAVIYVNNDYGRPLHSEVAASLRTASVMPILDEPYSRIDSVGAREFVAALSRARPELLVWLGRSADLAPLARQLRVQLPRLVILASDAFSRGAELTDSTRLFDAVQYVRFVDIERPDSALQHLRLVWRTAGHGELNDQAVLGYDAVELLAEGLKATGREREALPKWLSQLGKSRAAFPGLSGPIAFTSERERPLAYRLQEIAVAPVKTR